MCAVIYIFLPPRLTFLTVKIFPAGSATLLVSSLIIDIAFIIIKKPKKLDLHTKIINFYI